MKEVIKGHIDGSDYVHCCRYEIMFDYDEDNPSIFPDHKGGHFTTHLFLAKAFPEGPVKITIETVDIMEGHRIKCPECGSVVVEANEAVATTEHGEVLGYDYDPECYNCSEPVGEHWIVITEEEYLRALIKGILDFIGYIRRPDIWVDARVERFKKMAGIKE